jgi:hypothetical protein
LKFRISVNEVFMCYFSLKHYQQLKFFQKKNYQLDKRLIKISKVASELYSQTVLTKSECYDTQIRTRRELRKGKALP